jgi:O-methyltransferase
MIKKTVLNFISRLGYTVTKNDDGTRVPADMDKGFSDIYFKAKPFTMTSTERCYSLYKAVEYVSLNKIEGDIVECGVWKGGSSMISALTLQKMGIKDKNIYLYDTFEGMSEPTSEDFSDSDGDAYKTWEENNKNGINEWCYSPIDEVKTNLLSTGYPSEKLFFVKGKVEDTIPASLPSKISLLRLDTDWYESTYHEFVHLFPLLSQNGVLIIDDYGHWKGAREATDKYFREKNIKILLNRIDYTGRIGIKN